MGRCIKCRYYHDYPMSCKDDQAKVPFCGFKQREKNQFIIELVRQLRDETGVSFSEVKQALELCNYNRKMTVEYLKIKYSGVNYGDRDIMDVVKSKLN